MTTCDDSRAEPPAPVAGAAAAAVLAMQSAAVILIGFAALFLSFEPVWSAEGPQAALDTERCALRLAAAEDR